MKQTIEENSVDRLPKKSKTSNYSWIAIDDAVKKWTYIGKRSVYRENENYNKENKISLYLLWKGVLQIFI